MVIIIPVTIYNNLIIMASFQSLYAISAIVIFIFRKKINSRKAIALFILIPSYLVTFYALYTGNQDTYHWVYLFPVLTFFLLGVRTGLIANLIFLAITGFIGYVNIEKLHDSYTSLIIISLSHFLVISLTLLITYARDNIENLLHKNMITDGLTDIYNRQFFNISIKTVMDSYYRDGAVFSLLIYDLDNFKEINDCHGHNEGDKILIELTNLVKSYLRASDRLFRLGGEEFAIIMAQSNSEQSFIAAERIRNGIAEHTFESDRKITISMGISEARKGVSVEDLYCQADTALYEAKRTGRNKVCIHKSKSKCG